MLFLLLSLAVGCWLIVVTRKNEYVVIGVGILIAVVGIFESLVVTDKYDATIRLKKSKQS
jgi:membrane protein YdbS with pleckstrin-like domain